MVSLTSPAFGWLMDRWDAVRLSVIGFAILIVFGGVLVLSRTIGHVYAAFSIYGLAMGAVNIAWTMGPILFARDRDAASYMGVHVTMVGIRGLIGNPIGLLILETAGSRAAFGVATGLFVVATVLMMDLRRRMRAHAAA
jgi:MFS family permease